MIIYGILHEYCFFLHLNIDLDFLNWYDWYSEYRYPGMGVLHVAVLRYCMHGEPVPAYKTMWKTTKRPRIQ